MSIEMTAENNQRRNENQHQESGESEEKREKQY
jgi:hypothetical protein